MVRILSSMLTRLLRHAQHHWPFMAAWMLLLIIYTPTLVTTYGIHNDYSLLYPSNPSWFGFIETAHLFVIGRPIGGIAINIIFNTLKDIESFTPWRWIAFAFLGWFLAITVWHYLRHNLKLERYWAAIAVILIGITPPITLFILWICMIPPGIPNALIAVWAYLCLDHARTQNGWLKRTRQGVFLALAGFTLFVFSLYFYSPTTLVVFAMTFAHVVFTPAEKWPQVRARTITDISFWGVALVFYRITERHFLTPLLIRHETYHPAQTYYDMGFIHDIPSKLSVLTDAINVSAAGPWHFISASFGWLVPCTTVASVVAITWFRHKPAQLINYTRINIERTGWIIILFLLANLSVILPKGVIELLGYRLVMVSAMMSVFLCVTLLRWACERDAKGGIWVRAVAAILVATSLMATNNAFSRVLLNYTRELHFLRGSLASTDLSQKSQFAFIKLPPQKTLIPDPVPYEYSMMVTDKQHFIPFVTRALSQIGRRAESTEYFLLTPEYRGRVIAHPWVFTFDPQSLRYWDESK